MTDSLLRISVSGNEAAQAKLRAITDQSLIDNILDEAEAIFLGRIRARFLEKVDPDGVPWIPSQAGTRREASGGPGTGYDSGNLFRSIQEFEAGPNQRGIGTDVTSADGFPYAIAFQFGFSSTSKKGKSISSPARIFLGFGDDDQQIADNLVAARVTQILEQQ